MISLFTNAFTIQTRDLFLKVMTDEDRMHLFNNIAYMLKFAKKDIQMLTLAAFHKVHPSYAKGIAAATKIEWDEKALTAGSSAFV